MNETDYRRIFQQITPPPELVECAARAAEGRGARRPRRTVRRVVAVAAVVCLLAALGGSFAMVQTVDPASVRLETWAASELAVPVGVSDSSLGWTVTVDSVVGDAWYAYILCTLSRDDGGPMTPGSYGFGDWDFGVPEGMDNSSGIHWLADSDLTDNKIPFGFYLTNQNTWSLSGYTIRLTLEGLSTADYAESWALLLGGGGRWELEFTLPAEYAAEDFAPALTFELDGKEAVLEQISVSPLEIWAEFSSQEGAFTGFNGTLESYDQQWAEENRPCFLMADGSLLEPSGGGGGRGDGSGMYGSYRSAEVEQLHPEDIMGLQVGEKLYPLTLK